MKLKPPAAWPEANVKPPGLDPAFPSEDCQAVLRVSAAILEQCGNKSLYGSGDRLTLLLAAPEEDLAVQALELPRAYAIGVLLVAAAPGGPVGAVLVQDSPSQCQVPLHS